MGFEIVLFIKILLSTNSKNLELKIKITDSYLCYYQLHLK
jgi:hypothetical protein